MLGLEMGAEDYVTKPFNLPVLLARIRVVLRRLGRARTTTRTAPIRHAGVAVHLGASREVRVGDEPIELTQDPIRHPLVADEPTRAGCSRAVKSSTHVRSQHYAVTERAVDVQIVGLRKKLGEASALVETVRGVGYRFRDE